MNTNSYDMLPKLGSLPHRDLVYLDLLYCGKEWGLVLRLRTYQQRVKFWIHVLLTLVSVGFSALTAMAATPLSLESSNDFYRPLVDHMQVYIDPSAEMDIADVLQIPDKFEPVTTKYPDFGLTLGRVWLSTTLINSTGANGRWQLNINRQYYSEIDVYMVKPRALPTKLLRYTNENSFHDRKIPDRMLMIDLNLEDGTEAEIYIGFRSDSTSYLPAGVGTALGVAAYRSQENTFNWILNGALLAIIVFTLIMTPVIGWRLSISFSLYILAGLTFVFHADGYTFKHFWPEQKMAINDPLNLSFMARLRFDVF